MLNVTDTLSIHLPDYPQGKDITIHHLLTHSAGIPSFTGFEDFQVFKKQPATPGETVNRFKDLPLEFEPSTQYKYSNSGYVLLTHIIEQISGKSYADFLSEEFFIPLSLTNTGEEKSELIVLQRASGYGRKGEEYYNADYIDMTIPSGAGNLFSTTQDLYRWTLHLRQGRVVQPELFEVMKSPLIVVDQTTNTFYGYGLVTVAVKGQQLFGHDGGIDGFVTSAFYFPESNLTIVILCNVETCNTYMILGALKDIMLGKDVPLPVKHIAITLEPSVLARYPGDYELQPNFVLTIRLSENRLMGQATGQDEFELFASSETEFFTDFDAGATFMIEAGKVSGLVWNQGGGNQTARRLEA